MDHTEAQAFAEQWVRDWNAHDIDALLEHFTDDAVFTSPVAVRLLGGDGVIRGKEALRAYWSEGVRLIPDLRFEFWPSTPASAPWSSTTATRSAAWSARFSLSTAPWSSRATAPIPPRPRSGWRSESRALAPPGDQAHHALRAGELTQPKISNLPPSACRRIRGVLLALAASGAADGFLPVALSFAVLRVTASTSRLGLVLATQAIVALLVTLAGGLAGDGWPSGWARRWL